MLQKVFQKKLLLPDRKVDIYLMSNFEPKYVINLCPRLKLFWAH
jgi:hypothetical protein